MTPTLHAQASAVDVMATQARQRGNLKMKPKEWEMLEPRLAAAAFTLGILQSWRSRLPKEFIDELEGNS